MDVHLSYHHSGLKSVLLKAAREILEEEPLSKFSLRAVSRRAGVSHVAPYRHFPSLEALLTELAIEGFVELKSDIMAAGPVSADEPDRIANVGVAYLRFVAHRPALTRLMFGPTLQHREAFPALEKAADAVGAEIGAALQDDTLGLAVWAAIHGVAMLILENVIDIGQRRSGLGAVPSRAESLLRALFSQSSSGRRCLDACQN